MVKRLISADASEILKFTPAELKQSIKASEGRTVLSENVVVHEPVAEDITNAEVARAFGADLILLNAFNVLEPFVLGMYAQYTMVDASPNEQVIHDLKKLVGRPIGVNLEPVDEKAQMAENKLDIAAGRRASVETFKRAQALGFDFICLTGNPGTGVTNEQIVQAVKEAKANFDGLIIAGKMHGAGVSGPVMDLEAVRAFVAAGTDILLVPAVGTVPGLKDRDVEAAVDYAHQHDVLVMSAIGTSQESADPDTIKQFAIRNKILGVDIQHIGDAGYAGVAPVENIFALSKAIRGQRHTISRMARSINR